METNEGVSIFSSDDVDSVLEETSNTNEMNVSDSSNEFNLGPDSEDNLSLTTVESSDDDTNPKSSQSESEGPSVYRSQNALKLGEKKKTRKVVKRGRNNDEYLSNAKRRGQFAKRTFETINTAVTRLETVTRGKAFAIYEYTDGRGKKVVRECGSREAFMTPTVSQSPITVDTTTIVQDVTMAVTNKIGSVFSSLITPSELPQTPKSSQTKSSISSPERSRSSTRRVVGHCLRCGKENVTRKDGTVDQSAVSVVCSYGSGKSACKGSAHLYCLGFRIGSLKTAASMPDYFCDIHKE